jgi:hypothetical protein
LIVLECTLSLSLSILLMFSYSILMPFFCLFFTRKILMKFFFSKKWISHALALVRNRALSNELKTIFFENKTKHFFENKTKQFFVECKLIDVVCWPSVKTIAKLLKSGKYKEIYFNSSSDCRMNNINIISYVKMPRYIFLIFKFTPILRTKLMWKLFCAVLKRSKMQHIIFQSYINC